MSNHHKCKSTSIEHIDYHSDKDTLEIKFTSGLTYHYTNCPIEHYHELKKADSAGSYFAKYVRNHYDGHKVYK